MSKRMGRSCSRILRQCSEIERRGLRCGRRDADRAVGAFRISMKNHAKVQGLHKNRESKLDRKEPSVSRLKLGGSRPKIEPGA